MHRVKLKTDRKNLNNPSNTGNALDLSVDVDDQFLKDNLNTMEKMHQLRTQLEMKKRDKGSKLFNKSATKTIPDTELNKSNALHVKLKDDIGAEDGAVGGSACKSEAPPSKPVRKYSRRIYLPPLKGFIENATTLKKSSRTESDGLALTDCNVLGNKYQAQIATVKSIPSESSCLNGATAAVRADESVWPGQVINDAPKTKRKLTKSNWIQNFIEIMKTSKVPLSPSELIEIKESFESIRESMGKEQPPSPPADKPIDTKPSPFDMILSNFNKATTITSESYRSKLRDNIRRNRSFKAVGSNDLIIEENRVSQFKTRRFIELV